MHKKTAQILLAAFIAIMVVMPITGPANASSPVAVSSKAKINCAKADAALLDLNFQYQKLLFLNSASAWATTARDPLGGTLDGAALRSDAKILAGLKSVKTSQLGFPSVKKVLANATQLGTLIDSALASTTPFPGSGQDAYDLATKSAVGDRATLSYAFEKRCRKS